ncbi:hypothetical protein [Parasitella parasitica]|uniref:Homeobox domain-containing protein n=1 Tax=Parasitella parasitica TaxID=35722 RepID=A0A0B7MY73_9FUNG|nr:hypothetical protein [Parasitella parasitica]
MLSVRNLLIEPQTQPQSASHIHHAQHKEPSKRASVLNISSLLNDQDDSYTQINLSKRQHQCTYTPHYALGGYSPKLPSISSQHYYPTGKFQQRTARQHQLESREIERELLAGRRQSSSSASSSSVSSLIVASHQHDDDEKDNLPLKAKRRRASSRQVDVLNKVFERTFFPSTQLRTELGRQLGMSPRTVQIWFQNKRQAIRTRERSNSSRENSISSE